MEEKKKPGKLKKIMHILNPLAGKGIATQIKEKLKDSDYVYMSKSADSTTEFIKKTCLEDPDTCFTIYGGDGTVFKAVNALMESGFQDRASLKIVPLGSGNDFVRSIQDMPQEFTSDVMRVNDMYAINVINIGFDCSVVQRAQEFKKKPLVTGKMAYIMGVAGELMNKKPVHAKITLTYQDGKQEVLEDNFLLIAVGNGKWYGGGFKVAPGAKLDDGLLDVNIIRDISIPTFVSLVADFRRGTHIKDGEKCIVKPGTERFLIYKKCIGVKIEGVETACYDGEIYNESTVDIKVVPHAINLVKNQ